MVRPTSGTVSLLRRPVNGPQKEIGFVFQKAALLEWRGARANILLQAEMRGMDRAQAGRRADELIEMTGLTGFEKALPHELSGGMQQRVALCARCCTPAGAAHGRTVRCPGRADPGADERRTAPDLAGDRHHSGPGHPLHRRGGLPRHPGRGDERPARPDHPHLPGRAAGAPRLRAGDVGPRFDRLATDLRGLLGSAAANH
ncbi:ATP-binding cassette domain-containing protein [Micromonospora sp. M12]